MKIIGKTAEVRLRVLHPGSRAEAFDPSPLNDDFPAVLSNSRSVVELMELAAARLLNPWLAPAETSLGVACEVTHLHSAARDGEIRAVATCHAVSGRQYHFTIHAFDATGLIASCRHTRAIVSARRVAAGARKTPGTAVDVARPVNQPLTST